MKKHIAMLSPLSALIFQAKRRKLLGLLGLTLLAGCDDMFGRDKKKPKMDPEHGNVIEKDGQKFHVYVVAGTRFLVPVYLDTAQADPDGRAGFDLVLPWPDIPPGKAPGTQFTKSPPDSVGNSTQNQVYVQVHEDTVVRTGDAYQAGVQSGVWTSHDYSYRDDAELGLRLFTSKDATKELIDKGFFHMAYSLDKEVTTPFYHEPVVLGGGSIAFAYTKNIHVRIIMVGWNGRINPNWKGIYLGVVETLNNFRN